MIQDELLHEEIETVRASENDKIHIPLHRLQSYTQEFNQATTSDNKMECLNIGTTCCIREMYHYARVSGSHIFECVMDAALTAIRAEHLQEASSVRVFFHTENLLCSEENNSLKHNHRNLNGKAIHFVDLPS